MCAHAVLGTWTHRARFLLAPSAAECKCDGSSPCLSPSSCELRMRVAALLALLCAAADGLQAGLTPLPATAAPVAARAPVVLAQENSPFAKLANVPAPALVASFSGAGLVVVVRVPRRTLCMRLPSPTFLLLRGRRHWCLQQQAHRTPHLMRSSRSAC